MTCSGGYTGALTCYWRMPFREKARIVVTNENPDRSTGLYWQVDWVQLDSLPPQTPYFYARYRQEYPAGAGRDYLLADLTGKGYYVGTVLSVTLAQNGWFGEGDDFFYIDGEAVPSLQGTGSEDYFNDAWGFRVRTGPWFGQPRWQGDTAGDSGVCYRWHLLDPVYFIRLGIGRAVYAYRLAFDTLPDSLQTLVDKGFMPARYLRDENNLPLKSWREADAIFVESPGKDHWKHSWRGLDPRR